MALADAGHADPPWREVDKSRKAPKQVRRLLDEGIDRLLVWGGDGTVRRCIDTLVADDAKLELAILPSRNRQPVGQGAGDSDRPRSTRSTSRSTARPARSTSASSTARRSP